MFTAFPEAAKEEMLSAFVPWCAETCIEARTFKGEKPHQGFLGKNPALFLGQSVCNSTTALGLRGQATLNRIGSRCTGKERDSETGLDDFGARFYTSTTGRLTTPDDFLKDSDVSDPQSWNKYAYARNNPLRYVDPTGEEATVTKTCDTDNKSCQITVTATIAIYSVNGTTASQLSQAQAAITDQINNGNWNGSFTQDGTTYNVTTSVTVQIVDSEKTGISSGAQNVIGVDSSGKTQNSHVDEGGRNGSGQRYDRGIFDFSQVISGGTVPHEFSHLLGLDDNSGKVLSNNNCLESGMCLHPKATGQDFIWAFGPEIKSGRTQFNVGQYGGRAGGINARGNRRWWQGFSDRR